MATTLADGVEPDSDEAPEGGVRSATGGSRAFALMITGLLGTLASWVITIDENHILQAQAKGQTYTPGCSINPVVSCGNVMESAQAHVFGFPNPMIGLVAYPIVVCVGMSLLARARFPRWYWLTFNAGCLFGVGFCSWLQYQTLYSIGALCLWCCLAWVATITMFCYVTGHNIKHGHLPMPAGLRRGLMEFHWAVPVIWVGIIGMLVLTRWWSFWTGSGPA
jgi:uncharacterized membrane protein